MDTNINQSDTDDLAGDLLVGKGPIKAFLISLGMPETTDPYHLKRQGLWPIGKTGGEGGSLVASRAPPHPPRPKDHGTAED